VPKLKDGGAQTCPTSFQAALDASDVIGSWEWDIATDRVHADALVALLFNVDPDCAEAGASLAEFAAGIHPEDRERVTTLIGACARTGSSYVAEYRVCSADGVTRWILARGRYHVDVSGRPSRGRGIVIDITPSRMSEDAYVRTGRDAVRPLERAADHCVAAHRALADEGDAHLTLLSEMLLLELGRKLAKRESARRRKRMN
jgi:hypothetical protein